MTRRFVPLFAATLLAATPAFTQPVSDADDRCMMVAMIAEGVMTARQTGVPLAEILHVVSQSPDPRWRTLAIEAYTSPRYHTPAAQERATGDFRDALHVQCLRASR